MFNWNAHLRGAGFPMPSQSLMPITGVHMAQVPFQAQWMQQQQQQQQSGLGMMMGQGWTAMGQNAMFPSAGLAAGGLMAMPGAQMMGGMTPAPPPHPPPPLPAEPPPPPPPSTPKEKTPPPPPPKEPPGPEQKVSTSDQSSREPSEQALETFQEQPGPPGGPPLGQPAPPSGSSHGSFQGQVRAQLSPSPRPPSGQPPGQHGPSHGQFPGQHGSSLGQSAGQHGPSHGQSVGQHGAPQGLSSGQHGPSQGQFSGQHGLSQGQFSGQQGQFSGQQGPSQGQFSGQHGTSQGQFSGQHGTSQGQFSGQHGTSQGQFSGHHGSSQGQFSGHGTSQEQFSGQHGPSQGQFSGQHGPSQGLSGQPSQGQFGTPQTSAPGQLGISHGTASGQFGPAQGQPPGPFGNLHSPSSGQPGFPQGQAATGHHMPPHVAATGPSSGQLPEKHGQVSEQYGSFYGQAAKQQNVPYGPGPELTPAETRVSDPKLVAQLEQVKKEENVFLDQYKEWKLQYDDWREQNQSHPNKEQFEQYLEQWKTYEQQMEARRQSIEMQKQKLELELSQSTSSSSAAGAVAPTASSVTDWHGAGGIQSFSTEYQSQDQSGNLYWEGGNQGGGQSSSGLVQNSGLPGQNRDGRFMPQQEQRHFANRGGGGDSVTGPPPHRFDGGGNAGYPVMGMKQYSEGARDPLSQRQNLSTMGDEKGEEDMNLEEDDECGGVGGIIENRQQSWQGKDPLVSNTQQPSGSEWNSWSKGPAGQSTPGTWENQRDNFMGPLGTGSARGMGRDSQRGSHEMGGFRGRGRGDWNSSGQEQGPGFGGRGPPNVSSEAAGVPAQEEKEIKQQDSDDRENRYESQPEQFDDGASGSQDGFQGVGAGRGMVRGRGQWNGGGRGGDFQRGMGGEFQMGRGFDFQRGRGSEFQGGRGFDFQRGRGGNFQGGRGFDMQRGRGAEFQGSGRGMDFQRGRGGEFQGSGRGMDFQRERGEEFQGSGRGMDFQIERGGELQGSGRGMDFQRERGGEFQGSGRAVDFQRGRGGEFQGSGRGVDFQRGRGGEFQRGRGGDFQRRLSGEFPGEGVEGAGLGRFDFEGGAPRGRGGFPPRGRGGPPSLLSIDFDENMKKKFADFDPAGESTKNPEDNAEFGATAGFGGEGNGPGGGRGRGGDRYSNEDGGIVGQQGRGVGEWARGVADRGIGRGGFRGRGVFGSENWERGGVGMRGEEDAPGREGAGKSSYPGGKQENFQLGQSGRPAGGGQEESEQFSDSQFLNNKFSGGNEQLQKADTINSRGRLDVAGKGQLPEKGRLGNEGAMGELSAEQPKQFGQQEQQGEQGAADRGRTRRMGPDADEELEIKRGRMMMMTDERDEKRLMPPYPGGRFDMYGDRRADPFRNRDPNLQDPYLEPYTMLDPYGFNRFDRPGPPTGRRRMIPESIDYDHGGIEKKAPQPARVIDYGHGPASEGKIVDIESNRLGQGGADPKTGRDNMDQARGPELGMRDRDPSRKADMPRFGHREDEFFDHDHRSREGLLSRFPYGTSGDVDPGGDRALFRDRLGGEDNHFRGPRMSRFGDPRDEAWRVGDREGDPAYRNRDDGRLSGRAGHDFPEQDQYYNRRDDPFGRRAGDPYANRDREFMHEQEEGFGQDRYPGGAGDVDQIRDGRYGSYGRDPYGKEDRTAGHGSDRHHFGKPLSPPGHGGTPLKTATPPLTKAEVIKIEDLLCAPNRDSRPPQIVIIIRGLPGSGKTYVSKLLREKEISCGGAAPRMLCLDDYFMVDTEKEEVDQETGKKVKKKVLEYEYEQSLEEAYRQSLLKSFKKTVDDGFFPFIIVDATNEKVVHFSEFWSYAKSKGFQVYVGEMSVDVAMCIQRNIHRWTEWDIEKVKSNWEPLPSHYIRLDLRWLLQEDSIPEVVMEDSQDEKGDAEKKTEEEEEEEESESKEVYKKSKWELDTSEETLDKLDGIRVSKKHIAEHQSLNDYLQLDQMDEDYFSRESVPGKKRVRWADLEEKKNQSRRRNLGFIVGQTQKDWERITDDNFASKALNQTKYFYKN